MSTRGWKEFRRRRTFPVTLSLITNRVPFCTLKRRFFGKFDPLMEIFMECETTCREPPPGHVFVQSLAEIDRRKVVEVLHVTKKQRVCDPFFCALSEARRAISLETWSLHLFRRQPHLPSFIQIHPSFPDLLAKTTFQIVTIYGYPIGDRIADKYCAYSWADKNYALRKTTLF